MGYRHTREDLLASAVAVAHDRGIAAVTFKAVADRAGTNDRTVVYYFPSKADLITAVAVELGGGLQALLERAFGSERLTADELVRRAWPLLVAPDAERIFAIYFEMVGLACARVEPYHALSGFLVNGWIDWLTERIVGGDDDERHRRAAAVVAQLDGLLLVRHVAGAAVGDAAARTLGVTEPTSAR
jgi:AcrR family transcriptional regulator